MREASMAYASVHLVFPSSIPRSSVALSGIPQEADREVIASSSYG